MFGTISFQFVRRDKEPYINIRIEDDLSSNIILEVDISLEEYTKATIGSQANVPIQFTPGNLEYLGYIYETVTETIDIGKPNSFKSYESMNKAALKEVKRLEGLGQGWIARKEDVENHHNWTRGKVKVVFHRYRKITPLILDELKISQETLKQEGTQSWEMRNLNETIEKVQSYLKNHK